jgi:hypothetical protein
MSRTQIIALAVVVLLAGFVVFLSLRSRQAPMLPADENHARIGGSESCGGDCHGPDGVLPLPKNHTVRNDCLDCHGVP